MTITESNSSFLPKYLSFLLAILLLSSDDDHCGRLVLVTGVDDYTRADFPAGFVFGAGTSAYQVEGAAFEDGRTASIFDTLAHDGYVRGENTRKMFNLWWIQAWRPSNSPSLDGTGPINPKGLQFYNNFINELIRNGIEPHAMLCHSDLPQILEDKYGGRVSQESVKDFTAYANVCFREFGDRVSHWTTFNEPNVFVPGGYDAGITQPVRCSPPFGKNNCSTGNSTFEPYIAAHNILLDREDKDLTRYSKLSAHWYSTFLKDGNISRDEFLRKFKGKNLLLHDPTFISLIRLLEIRLI